MASFVADQNAGGPTALVLEASDERNVDPVSPPFLRVVDDANDRGQLVTHVGGEEILPDVFPGNLLAEYNQFIIDLCGSLRPRKLSFKKRSGLIQPLRSPHTSKSAFFRCCRSRPDRVVAPIDRQQRRLAT